jgi:D-alanyl-D-alanine carboxypeptidase
MLQCREAFSAQIDPGVSKQLQAALDSVRTQLNIPGISAAVINSDNESWLGASGYADVDNGTAVTTETLFSIGSITKTLTASVVLALAESGELSLDDTIGDWISDVPRRAGKNIDKQITLRQLMNHTSGINSYTSHLSAVLALYLCPDKNWQPDEVLRFVGRPYFPAGTGWYYSNTNYYLLGMIAEAASGRAFHDVLRERILEPHGLDAIFLDGKQQVDGALSRGYAEVRGRNVLDPLSVQRKGAYTFAWTAGAGVAAAEQLAAFSRLLFSARITTQPLLNEMLDFTDTGSEQMQYGLGVFSLEDSQYGTFWGHNGAINGYKALMLYLPVDDMHVTVLINQAGADEFAVARALLEVLVPCLEGL